jgi:hypothetical protein
MADFQSDKSHFNANNVSYFLFYLKSEKLLKALIHHLPHYKTSEGISDGFDVVSVKQMTATRRSPTDGSKIINFRLVLISPKKYSKCKVSVRSQLGRRKIELRMVLRSVITASSSATSGQTESNFPAACGAEAVTCTKSAPRRGIYLPPQHVATVGWRKEGNPVPQIIGAADTRWKGCRK